jgi:hypothetical protein
MTQYYYQIKIQRGPHPSSIIQRQGTCLGESPTDASTRLYEQEESRWQAPIIEMHIGDLENGEVLLESHQAYNKSIAAPSLAARGILSPKIVPEKPSHSVKRGPEAWTYGKHFQPHNFGTLHLQEG